MSTKRQSTEEPAILTAVWAELMRLAEAGQLDEEIVYGLCLTLYLHDRATGRQQNPDKKIANPLISPISCGILFVAPNICTIPQE